jgi:16S rRNA (cytosine967-C5)-methyltransferase
MSFFLEHMERIIASYKGHPPLAIFLKTYFKQYPRLGSRDRKALSEGAYIYYRSARFCDSAEPVAGIIAKGIVWCNSRNAFLKKMMGDMPHAYTPNDALAPEGFDHLLSPSLSAQEWFHSLWQQPQLFIRLRGKQAKVPAILKAHEVAYEHCAIPGNQEPDCLRIPNGTAIDQWLPEQEYVVQDWASQASIYALLQKLPVKPAAVWDVCSGAGGKSILLRDKLPSFALTATDVRESILHNLRLRFRKYNLGKADTRVVNSADKKEVQVIMQERQFDLVLCDVPCSGSGTWARTPEQFRFFTESNLKKFEDLQLPIALNASRHVAPGGTLAYITCSVFEKENESVVQRLLQETPLELVSQQLINGIPHQADALFLAVFRNPAS